MFSVSLTSSCIILKEGEEKIGAQIRFAAVFPADPFKQTGGAAQGKVNIEGPQHHMYPYGPRSLGINLHINLACTSRSLNTETRVLLAQKSLNSELGQTDPPHHHPLQRPCSLRGGKKDGNSLYRSPEDCAAPGGSAPPQFAGTGHMESFSPRPVQDEGCETGNLSQHLCAYCRHPGGFWPQPAGQLHQHHQARPRRTEPDQTSPPNSCFLTEEPWKTQPMDRSSRAPVPRVPPPAQTWRAPELPLSPQPGRRDGQGRAARV